MDTFSFIRLVLLQQQILPTFNTIHLIRLVNYIRLEKPSPGFVMSLSSSQKWADPAFLKPQIPDDPLLMFDFDQELTAEAGGEDEEENLLSMKSNDRQCVSFCF